MHREFQADDLEHLRLHAFDATEVDDHDTRERSSLYRFTAFLGLLIGGELLGEVLGIEAIRAPVAGIGLATIAAVIGGARIVYGALEALLHGKVGADIALAQACLAALVIGEPFVAAEVVFIAMVGEVLEAITFERARREIHRLVDQAPRTARVLRDDVEVEIPASAVKVGDRVIVRDGERIPVDGSIVEGRSSIDQSALTGEPIPVDRGPGDPVFSGTINQFGRLEILAERVGHETTIGRVLALVASARKKKAPVERLADRMARWFLPVVEVAALLTLLGGWWFGRPDKWSRAVAVLVTACPCALILATPAAVLAAMAWMGKRGILVKGSVALERLAACDVFAFDKTGTLTRGRPEIAAIESFDGRSENELLALVAAAEAASRHPLARLVVEESLRRGLDPVAVVEAVALPGSGVTATLTSSGDRVLVGSARLMAESAIEVDPAIVARIAEVDARGETPLLAAVGSRLVGLISARDAVRREAHDVIHDLKHLDIKEIVVLTGDRAGAAKLVAKKVHLKTVHSELLPADKARWIEERQTAGGRVAMVGDGINDAPALARADVGIALARVGSDLAAEAGDILIMGEPLVHLPGLVALSRSVVRIIWQNIIIFAIGLNVLAIGSAAFGFLGPVAAAVLHQVGSLLVLLNAMRLLWFDAGGESPAARLLAALRRGMRRFDDWFDLERIGAALARWRRPLAVAGAIFAAIAYSISGWVAVGPGEVVLVIESGRPAARLEPGLHPLAPWPLTRVRRIDRDRLGVVEIGFRSDSAVSAVAEEEMLMMTGDDRLIEVSAAVQFRAGKGLDAERALAFGVHDPAGSLRPIAEAVLRETVGRTRLESMLSGSRREIEAATVRSLQARVDRAGLGLEIAAVSLQDVHPPRDVLEAYRDVARAEAERARFSLDGETYRLETMEAAKSAAKVRIEAGSARAESMVERASARAESFRELVQARTSAPGSTDRRLYGEAIAEALAGKSKLIVDPAGGARRRLFLNPADSDPTVGPPRLVPQNP